MRLGLENRQDYMEQPGIDEMGALLSEHDPAVAGFWYDVGHAALLDRLGFIPHAEWLRRYGPRMVDCHLHDVIGATDHRAPGAGDVDLALVASGIPAEALRVLELHHSAARTASGSALPFLRERGCWDSASCFLQKEGTMGKVRYSVVYEWDEEEKLFVATVPALSVSTYGETKEEAAEMVKEAIAVTIEGLRALGQPVPQGDEGVVEMVEVNV